MMIKSMTGFGAGEQENESYKVHVEVKSVNQRFLEMDFHMPRLMNAWEDDMRKTIKSMAARGKFDIYVTFRDKREAGTHIHVNRKLAEAYRQALDTLSESLDLPRLQDVQAIASYPDVLVAEETASLTGCDEVLIPALEQAMQRLDDMRLAEGENIRQDFCHRLENLKTWVAEAADWAPEIVAAYRARIEKTLSELLPESSLDETRIIQETALYADKVNFTEEVVRLKSHFQQFRAILDGSGSVGRKLDFLIQEMNREANTIGSKANDAKMARVVVEIKGEIEKLREQVQNIE